MFDRLGRISIVTRVIIVTVAALALLAVANTVVTRLALDRALQAQVGTEAETSTRVLLHLLSQQGQPALVDGTLHFGDWSVADDFAVVDAVKRLTGAETSIFQLEGDRLVRVSTTLPGDKNGRALGTVLAGPAAEAFRRGESYVGVNPVLGEPYVTRYDPLRDRDGRAVGVVGTGQPLAILGLLSAQVVTWGLATVAVVLVVTVALVLVGLRPLRRALSAIADGARTIAQDDLPGFVKAAEAVASGDLMAAPTTRSRTLSIHGQGEVDQLAADFNHMIESLETARAAFGTMTGSLRGTVGLVRLSSQGLATTAELLGETARETSIAVGQVTGATQQIAQAAATQSTAVSEASGNVAQLVTVIGDVAQGAHHQAQAVATATATARQLAEGADDVAASAQAARTSSQETRARADQGARAVEQTVVEMRQICETVDGATRKVEALGKLGEKIGAVVETIDDIADQTNLLALNAAIEAARAGQHGTGFAIVADEVRKLAERSRRETQTIADLIAEVRRGMSEAVAAMEAGSRKVEAGSQRAGEAGRALGEIVTAVEATVHEVGQIAGAAKVMSLRSREVSDTLTGISSVVEEATAASEEMAASADEVGRLVHSISDASVGASAATEEVSASAEEMSAQVENVAAQVGDLAATAEQLRALAAGFRVDAAADQSTARDRRLTAAVRAHTTWRLRLEQAIETGTCDVTVATARRDDVCPFGRWVYQEIDARDRQHPQYEPVRELHARFHTCAADVLQLALSRRKTEARAAIGAISPFARTSIELTRALSAWRRDEAAASGREDTPSRRIVERSRSSGRPRGHLAAV